MKVWVHELAMVVFMVKVLKNKYVVGLVCSIDRISDELSLTSVKKGFKFKELKEKTMQDVCDCWDEFFKVLQIEMDELAKDSQKAFE